MVCPSMNAVFKFGSKTPERSWLWHPLKAVETFAVVFVKIKNANRAKMGKEIKNKSFGVNLSFIIVIFIITQTLD